MKKNKKIIIAIAAIIVVIIIALVFTLVLKGKNGSIFNSKSKEIEEKITKMFENNKIKIEVNNAAYQEGYLVIEYDVTSKEGAEYFDECFDTTNGLDYYLERTILLNGEAVEETDQNMQFAERVSDTEAKVYDFIEIEESEIESNNKIEISIYDTSYMFTETEDDGYLDEEYDESIDGTDEGEYTEESEETFEEEYNEENYEEGEDEYDEELYEEVEGEYIEGTDEEETNTEEELLDETEDETEEYIEKIEEEDDDSDPTEEYTPEGTLLGKIALNLTKEEITKEVRSKELIDSAYEYEDISITKANLLETSFGKFLIIDSEIKNVTDEEVFNDLINVELNIQDENGNTITASKNSGYQIFLEDGTNWGKSDVETFSNGTLKYRTIISLNKQSKELNKIKIVPILPTYYEETEEEINAMSWNKIEDKTYEATSEYGGKIEITKIEEKDGNINFYYKDSGLITETDTFIIVRNVEKGDYVICDGRKITESGEKVITFKMDKEGTEEKDKYLDNIENLEFAVFEGTKVTKAGEGITIEL